MQRKTHPVVVVGAGIGGLSAALCLASKGVPVTLIEQHDHVGGKIRQVSVANRMIDAGPTVFTMPWVFEKLFSDAGLKFNEYVKLTQSTLLARHSWVGSDTLDLYTDVDQSAAAIEALMGAKDALAYRTFAAKSEAVFNTLNESFMSVERPGPLSLALSNGITGLKDMALIQPFSTLWASLNNTFSDPRLVQLFARYATYCGSSPLQAPATLMLIAHVERAGVWAVDGGMHALAQAMLKAIKDLGCECVFGHSVQQILTDTSGVKGVLLDNGTEINARSVVFNGDTHALSTGLLGKSCSSAVKHSQAKSLSAITRCEVAQSSGFDLAHHTVFFGEDYPAEFNAIYKRENHCDDPTVYVCAQDRAIGGGSKPHGTERLFSLMNAPARDFQADDVHHACGLITDRLTAHGLRLENQQGVSHIDTPNSFADLFPATHGALYGRPTHGWMGSFNRPGSTSQINGLYLAGGSVHPGAGVPMAALSGKLAAQKVFADF